MDESRTGIFRADDAVTADSPPDARARIECAVRAAGDQVAIAGSVELSRLIGVFNSGGNHLPIIDQFKLAFHKTVDPGKPSLLSEDPKRPVEVRWLVSPPRRKP